MPKQRPDLLAPTIDRTGIVAQMRALDKAISDAERAPVSPTLTRLPQRQITPKPVTPRVALSFHIQFLSSFFEGARCAKLSLSTSLGDIVIVSGIAFITVNQMLDQLGSPIAADLFAAISDNSDATYIQADPLAGGCAFSFDTVPVAVGLVTLGDFTVRAQWITAGDPFHLFDAEVTASRNPGGDTVTHNASAIAVTGSWVDYTFSPIVPAV